MYGMQNISPDNEKNINKRLINLGHITNWKIGNGANKIEARIRTRIQTRYMLIPKKKEKEIRRNGHGGIDQANIVKYYFQ